MMTDTLLRPGEACLMHGMAERLGADVVRAAASGEIAPEELSRMETSCAQCTQHDACILWLLEHQGRQEQTPDYCLNAQKLYYVRALQNQVLAAE
ncbi:DUF6455 family protein [Celeribacter persicus]|jgi:hypothetical protein|uniref:DUF6455 domain-containing protein n=1 Tax=Celeribacter persicus TaxID=1651082 RepID=A0A2T5HVR8_9RHOB|nr:DUF6455 family protein [Celeribacter persicus]PTQ75664.1 hypothetical protein C8N42_101203 [Celeribacter persicus]